MEDLLDLYEREVDPDDPVVNFMFTETLASWRKVNVRRTKTMIDWAEEIHELLNIDYPKAKKVILVCTI